ncbi:uncharacterized protein LOC9650015 isoform X1 [Selaginella moellendorffii]|nr:uncharacterized protein LOC9650015 isoform X1 [Selaginella moellendorffii]|eukprot:XP_002989242.2 uncharacterized protein LOC9650015 isoform X1 [Selaginella moellendorffii]
MMGRGAEGGVSSSLSHRSDQTGPKLSQGRGMDIYSQAVKALAVKSPFAGDEAGNAGGAGAGFSGPLVKLPNAGDPKRKNRARKTQAVSKKREFGDLDDGNPRMFWVQMEDYFREVIAEDVKLLFPRTSFGVIDSSLAQDSCFNVRPRGRRYLDIWAEEDRKFKVEGSSEENKSARGIKRKLLTASPVSKRRKAALVTPDTITTVISPVDIEEEDQCHVCSSGDSDAWNQIIFCESCNVAVHQECYGVQSIPDGQWLCSWCAYRQRGGGAVEADDQGTFSCVLCPCKRGALKPVAVEADSSSKQTRFAHLFCTQWVPETFLQDTVAMEPVKNVEGVREERWRLVCIVCKERHGACIQCSHGLCATAFHPLCARDAKLLMEVSSREDTDEVDLRAYCPKHSAIRVAKPVEPVALKEGSSDDKIVNAVVTGNTGKAGQNNQAVDAVLKGNASVEATQSPSNERSPSNQPVQEELIANVKKVTQTIGISMETVASEVDVPQSTLLLWLEGKLHEDESKINTSISAWLCTYSSLLKCSVSGSDSGQSVSKLKRNGYSDELSPSHGNSPENTATFSTGPVKINCQLLQVEEDFGSFGDEADDRPSVAESLQGDEIQKPMMTVMQNQSRLFDNEVSNGIFDSDSPGLEASSPQDHEDSIDAGGTDQQLYVIPGVMKRLLHMEPNLSNSQTLDCSFSGQEELECSTSDRNSLDEQWQQLRKAKHLGVLDWCPQDEVEAEIFLLQNQLIDRAQSNRVMSERLISRILCQLSKERQAARKQLQDLLFVSQFLADVKEARKQGRKEKKDREAQAVLAAATAAAAASPRTGYVKRDLATHDDPYYPTQDATAEYKLNHGNPHSPYVRPFKPPVPKPPRLNVSSSFRVQPAFYRHEDQYACDVCSSNESLRLNRIVHCHRCNVAVHQDCYGIHPFPTAPWYCQPCTELQYQPVKLMEDGDRIAPGVQCALCPIAYGAFKKSSDGRWVHVFCALWVPKTTFGREQSCPIGGLEAVPSERLNLTCTICQQQQGACIKCNFGHCSGAFHPMCARDSGLYISARNINGRAHYRAFCERHSPQQRAKSADFVSQAELKQYGSPDEINALRQIRVEFERVRLICERICKRERIKRELTHCIKDLYINQLVAVVGGHSVDQAVNHQKPGEGNGPLYSDSLLDVPWTAESRLTEPIWPAGRNNNTKELTWSTTKADANTGIRDQKKLRRFNRHSEPLGREKIMTPTEASMHNRLLPKGFAYVPVDVLEKGVMKRQQEQATVQPQQQESDQQQQNHQHQDHGQDEHKLEGRKSES